MVTGVLEALVVPLDELPLAVELPEELLDELLDEPLPDELLPVEVAVPPLEPDAVVLPEPLELPLPAAELPEPLEVAFLVALGLGLADADALGVELAEGELILPLPAAFGLVPPLFPVAAVAELLLLGAGRAPPKLLTCAAAPAA